MEEDRARRDIVLLFATRSLRMFAYGFLAVVLVLYLEAVGLNGAEVGLLLALTLLGDAAISLLLTTRADRFGRRRTLFLGSLLMLGAGLVFASSSLFPVLARRRHPRRAQPERERGRAVPRDRAGVARAARGREGPDLDVRPVPGRGLRRHRAGLAGGRRRHPGRCSGPGPRRPTPTGW